MDNLTIQVDWQEKYEKLEVQISDLKSRNSKLEALVNYYEEQIRLAKHRQFGASSEKFENAEQIGLFDEAENTADKDAVEPEIEEITYKRKKRVGKREEDLAALPVETIEYTLPEADQICQECGEDLHVMSKQIRKELKIIPAQVSVVEHVSYIYSCRACEKNNDHVQVIKADSPDPLLKGSIASPSVVAHVAVEKYVKSVPLYRQEQSFLRDGIPISRQNMANWLIFCAENYLLALYMLLKTYLLKETVLHADETVLQVLQEQGKKANTNSYEWLYRTSGCAEHPIVLYEYQPTRSSSHPKAFLKGFEGYLHTDGYAAYHTLPNITVIGCWAHARRKFDEALKAIPVDNRKGSVSEIGLQYCQKLFDLERKFAELSPEERHKKRLEQSKPVSDAFFAWANSAKVMPKMAIGKAIKYALDQREYLENVFLDGRLELSNNRAERSIKPFVIGRKNWLFSNSTKGAQASSILYSIIETAKENELRPFEYLKYLLEQLPNITTGKLESLLPWSFELPDYCHCPVHTTASKEVR